MKDWGSAVALMVFGAWLLPALWRAVRQAWIDTHCVCIHSAKDHHAPRGCEWCGCRAFDLAADRSQEKADTTKR